MRLFLGTLATLLTLSAWSQDTPAQATLLLGIHGLEGHRKQRVYSNMKREFKYQWDRDFNTKVIEDASYLDLFKTLRNPYQQVIFWVSHAGSFNRTPGLSQGLVTDSYGDDVKNVFKLIPENLYWLGLIGCKAEPILRRFEAAGYYDHLSPRFITSSFAASFPFGINVLHRRLRGDAGLVIDSSDRLVEAFHGLRSSMTGAKWPALHLAEPPAQSCQAGPALHLEALRTSEDSTKSLAAISLEINEYPVTIFDRQGQYSHYPILLPLNELDGLEDVSIVVQGREGFNPLKKDEELGELTIWSPTLGLHWRRVEVGGRPLGQTQNVYRLDEESKVRFASLRTQGVTWSHRCFEQ